MRIGELCRVLRDSGILGEAGGWPTPAELADALWLAALLRSDSPAQLPVADAPPAADSSAEVEHRAAPQNQSEPSQAGLSQSAAPPQPNLPKQASARPPPASPVLATLPVRGTVSSGVLVSAAARPQLPDSLALARAMRPLRRLVPSATRQVLDEIATANLRAEQQLWLPALAPGSEPAFDLAIVIDDSESMALWDEKIREFRLLCERLGAFRDVRLWRLSATGDDARATPVLRSLSRRSQARDERELADPSGRRIILVITDGVHPWWRPSGPLRPVLARWALASPLAIVQPFPQRLWDRSPLRPVIETFRPGWPGSGPTIRRPGDEHVAVPILELTPAAMRRWAGSSPVPRPPCGCLRPTYPERVRAEDAAAGNVRHGNEAEAGEHDPAQLVRNFRASVSPAAYQLAGYLSAAPLTLPVMRLVQESMMPETGSAELAEVFLSGLLRKTADGDPAVDAESTSYVFAAGVRDVLQSTLTRGEAVTVLDQVGNYLVRSRQGGRRFPVLLQGQPAGGDVMVAAEQFPAFGQISAALLKRIRIPYEGAVRPDDAASIDASERFQVGDDSPTHRLEVAYRQRIAKQCDRLELFGLNFASQWYALSTAYVKLTLTVHDAAATNGPERGPAVYRSSNVEHWLAECPRLLINGRAGGGKTTILQWIAVGAARRDLTGPAPGLNGLIPFFIRLREYVGRALPQPEQFLDKVAPLLAPEVGSWPRQQLIEGRAIVLIDGIDEVPEAQRREVLQWLRDLTARFPQSRYVATTRPGAIADDALADAGLTHAVLEPMNPALVRTFISQWHAAMREREKDTDAAARLDSYRDQLLLTLENARFLSELATTPLLAGLMCALNQHRAGQLPRRRGEIFEQALAMFHERDRRRGIESDVRLDLTATNHLLGDLALWMIRNAALEVPESIAREILARSAASLSSQYAADELYRYVIERSGLLREPTAGHADFVHRAFQEYLAAKALVAADNLGEIVRNASDDQWHQVVILAAGQGNTRQTTDLLRGLMRPTWRGKQRGQRRLLAVASLDEIRIVDPEVLNAIYQSIEELLPPKSLDEAEALSHAGERLLPHLRGKLPDAIKGRIADSQVLEFASVIRTAALIGGPQALDIIAEMAKRARSALVPHTEDGSDIVTYELTLAWDYFRNSRYAERVLLPAGLSHIRVDAPWKLAELTSAQEAITARRQAATATPADDPDRATRLSDLAASLDIRFGRTHVGADLDEAITAAQEAVAATPPDHPDRGGHLADLVAFLYARFERDGDSADLDDAIAAEREAVAATPVENTDRAVLLANLGAFLYARFERDGGSADLDDAITAEREAVAATPVENTDRAGMLTNLGTFLYARFERDGGSADLDDAIAAGQEAVAAAPGEDTLRARRLAVLRARLYVRFERDGGSADLDDAIRAGREAADAIPADHPDRAGMLMSLGTLLATRFTRVGGSTDLDDAITAGRRAVAATPADHPDRAGFLSILGTWLATRFERAGRPRGRG